MLRYRRSYVVTDVDFEFEWYKMFLGAIARRWLSHVDTIYEFGCGSAYNVATLSKMFPKKKVWGLDWSAASVRIVDVLNRDGFNVEGRTFDLFNPNTDFELEEGSAVLTVGALEQTGEKYGQFMRYLLDQPISMCVNVEPIVEWYDENKLFDYLAIMFHTRRRYMWGFPSLLERLGRTGMIEVLKQVRSDFGSTYIEGYSQNVWRPRKA